MKTSDTQNVESVPRWYELTPAEQRAWCKHAQIPLYRREQIQNGIFHLRVTSFHEIHTLPLKLREELENSFSLFPSKILAHQKSRDGTEKLLLAAPAGGEIECVLMREGSRHTVCLSTQVGCAMGCVFCASGLRGWRRNLSAGEILEQVLRLNLLLARREQLTNVVVMGMGEPLANLPAVLSALDLLCSQDGLGLSPRRITISTVGLPEKIVALARHGRPYNLAVSLHAPTEELRARLVPIHERIGLKQLFTAVDEYVRITRRRVSYEYVLLKGVNDRQVDAQALIKLLQGRLAHVNLIPMNPVHEVPWAAPGMPDCQRFVRWLQEGGITVTVRKRKGADIDAACGQLRLQRLPSQSGTTVRASEGPSPMTDELPSSDVVSINAVVDRVRVDPQLIESASRKEL